MDLPLPSVLYHGTTELYLEAMLATGLEPCNMTGEVLMLCLTDEIEIALHHAEFMSSWEARPPIVFAIPIERFDPSLFTLEDNFVRIGPSSGRGVAAYQAAGEDKWESAAWTWRSMLHVAGAVGYTGAVPVTRADLLPVITTPTLSDTDRACFELNP